MSRPSSTSSSSPFADLQKAINVSFKAPLHEEGWRTIEEVAEELNVTVREAYRKVRAFKKAGLVDVWRGHVSTDGGPRVSTARYRVKAA